jgi:alkylated DNA repair protein (DNA oxidative demethylase)
MFQSIQANLDLFGAAPECPRSELLSPGAWLLRAFALGPAPHLVADVERIASQAPFRHMETKGGFRMSVAMTNCGMRGWCSDRRGYRYEPLDGLTARPWPAMPDSFLELARSAAEAAGFQHFVPDACLVNRYQVGARMSLHQDKDECDFSAPIVSISLGLPAVFLWGGDARAERPQRVTLQHGDAVVWGGPARLRHHGVLPLKPGLHPLLGAQRLNLTFRRAGSCGAG